MSVHAGRVRLDDADDRVLVGRAVDGDVRAFEVLIRRYGPLVRAYARRILGTGADLDDAVQETFITAWQQLHALDDTAALRGWLITIVNRKSIDQVRRRRQHAVLGTADRVAATADEPHAMAEVRSRHEALASALSRLPDDQRRCWMMKEVAHYSYSDIAQQLDLPVSTVRGTLSRARKNLIEEMEAWR